MDQNELLLNEDKKNRDLICNNTSQNYFVGAGAGSGKTTSLVQRMVNLVINGCNNKEVNVSEICTITFTKVAANEFKERFQVALAEALEDKEKKFNYSQIQKDRIKRAIQDIDLAFMGTIDAFCEKLIKEHPLEAKVPASSKLVDQAYLDNVYLNVYNNFRYLDNKDELKLLFNYFQNYNGKNAKTIFKNTIPVICSNRDGKLIYNKVSDYDIDVHFANAKNVIKELLKLDCSFYTNPTSYEKAQDFIYKNKRILNGNWADNTPEILKLISSISAMPCFKYLKDPRDIISNSFDYIEELTFRNKPAYKFNDKLLNDLYNYIFNISMEFLDKTKQFIIDKLRKTGEFNFCDNLYYVKEMLTKDSQNSTNNHQLIRNIQKRFKYFFLDEFQDTDPMQIQIFFYLSAEKIDKDWFNCVPFDGSLFIVGDEKQSIYKFKGADIRSYEYVKSIFKKLNTVGKGEILSLSCNFRSRNSLIDYFNNTFKMMFDNDRLISNEQCEYPYIPKVIQKDENVGNNKILEGAKYFTCNKKLTDIKQIPLLIDHIKKQYKILRYNKSTKTYEVSAINNSDFMILVRKNAIPNYEKELKKYGIGSIINGKIEFNSCNLLKTIRSILYYLSNTDFKKDKNSLYELLSTELFSRNLVELKEYQELKKGKIAIPEVNNILEEIEELSKKYSYSPSLFIRKLLGLKAILNTANLDNLNILYYVINKISEIENNGEICTLLDAYNYIVKLSDEKNDLNHNLSLIDKEDKVLIANIHQVKGDEREIVILADNDRDLPSMDEIYNDYLNKELYIFTTYISPLDKTKLLHNTLNEDKREINSMLEDFEFTRQLYVAATRARSCFIMSIPSEDYVEGKNISNKLVNTDMMENIDSVIAGPSELIESMKFDAKEVLKIKDSIDDKQLKEKTYKITNPSKEVHKSNLGKDSSFIPDYFREEDPCDFSKSIWKDKANFIGTLTHRFMELLGQSRLKSDPCELIGDIIVEYDVDCDDCEMVCDCLLYVYNEEVRKNDIFNIIENAKQILTEVPFSYKDNPSDNVIKTGFMDLVYEDENGWHIIDYKTNADLTDLDELYASQLEIYKKAFKLINGVDADANTYHIDVNSFKGVIHDN